MKRLLSPQPFSKGAARLFALLGVGVFVLLLFWRGVTPEANDDAAIARLLADPEGPWVPFVHPLLAGALRFLMRAAPVVNWWSVTLFAVCALGAGAMGYYLSRTLPRGLFVLILLPALFVMYRLTAMHLTFTRSAALSAAGGASLCLYAVFRGEKRPEQHLSYLLGGLLVVLGTLIRKSSGLLTVFFLGVAVFSVLLQRLFRDASRADVLLTLRKALMMLPVLGLALAVYSTASPAVGSPAAEYSDFQHQRSQVMDYRDNLPPWEEQSEAYLAAGITRTDYELLKDWNSYDTELVTAERLETLASFRERTPLSAFLRTLYKRLADYDVLFCVLLILPFLVWDHRRFFSPLLLGGAAVVAVILYFGFLGRLPARIFETAVFDAILLSLVAGAAAEPEAPLAGDLGANRLLTLLAPVCMLAFTVLSLPPAAAPFSEASQTRQQVTELLAGREGVFFTVTSGHMPGVDDADPWLYPKKESEDNVFPLGGWQTRMPHLTERLAREGIENPFRSLTERPDVYAEYDLTVLRFLQEHYGADITCSRAVSLPEGVCDELSFASYLHFLPEGSSVKAALSPVEVTCDSDFGEDYAHWRFTGRLLSPVSPGQRLYCNAVIAGEERTFAVDLAEDGSFLAEFYALPPEADPDNAAMTFFFR